jgi:CBS domain containing-hemolysin-like protein
VLTLINGAFAMAEMALVSARKARLAQKADAGDAGARAALDLVDNPTRFLSTVQLGMTLVGIVAGAFGGSYEIVIEGTDAEVPDQVLEGYGAPGPLCTCACSTLRKACAGGERRLRAR